ncbi:MAG: SPOR domain-containing protein [Candidatus Omnitrophota bacterium]
MGLFRKKKNTEAPSSILSESEIQKKLYGEFYDRSTHVLIGDREHFREPAAPPFVPKETPPEKEVPFDLFSVQTEALAESEASPHRDSSEVKPGDHATRYVPLQDFEKKAVSSTSASSSSDPSSRFRYNRPQTNLSEAFLDFLKGFSGKIAELTGCFLDPKQVALRRFIYWGSAILVVFLLFFGVNSLNSQREEAMRTRYKIPGDTVQVKPMDAESTVVPSKPAAERPVVITPAPVRSPKAPAVGTVTKPVLLAAESYVIQVVTYPSAQDADSIVKTLKGAGFHAFAKESARPSGRVFYMVLIGGFRTAADAQSLLLKFRGHEVARPFQDAFVRTNRS